MKEIQHTAFYITHDGDKDWLINNITEGNAASDFLPLTGLKGAVFSNSTLHHFINEEIRHDQFEIDPGNRNSLTYSSSGEQRKALLSYIIAKKPGYLIIDSVFESLDKNARKTILQTLEELSATTLIIQVLNRRNELLPFIDVIYIVSGQAVTDHKGRQSFLDPSGVGTNFIFDGTIPAPSTRYGHQTGPLVKMNNVNVQFNGRPILKNICWEIKAGEFWQLIGPNGSGKTTLLSLITGNSPKGYGQDLTIFGFKKGSGETVWDIKKMIGYFTPSMTMQFERQDSIEKMVVSGFFDSVGLYIKPSDGQLHLAGQWLSLLGMYNDRNKPFLLLPAGHQRMVLIARAMVKHPPLLILDEPTSGLDDEMIVLFTTLVNKIAAETDTAILYVSHRDEAGLTPAKIFELLPSKEGSSGFVHDIIL